MREEQSTSRPARVLVVDDEPHVARFLEFVLAGAGYQAAVATDGEGALVVAERFVPDAVLLDPVLPGLSGCEVTKRLRSRAKDARLVILVLGHGTKDQTREDMIEAGAGPDAYLTRPVKPSTLLEALDTLGVPPILG